MMPKAIMRRNIQGTGEDLGALAGQLVGRPELAAGGAPFMSRKDLQK